MKVKAKDSLEYKLAKKIDALSDDVFLRTEVSALAPPRQFSRVLSAFGPPTTVWRHRWDVFNDNMVLSTDTLF